MKILFIARHYSYLRMFESVIAGLAERGHEIVLAHDRDETMGGREMVERLAARYPRVRLTSTPRRRGSAWADVARKLRLGIDYLRFVRPEYERTPHLRARSRERAPRLVVRAVESALLRSLGGARLVGALLRSLEKGLPSSPDIEAFIRAEAPDLLMITPLVDIGSPQLDYLAAARRCGVRTALPVGSWDHLSSKSLLRDIPERIFVWNPVQQAEAIDMHGVPPERVVVTGAQCYDQWFGRAPSRSREAFCRRVGLRADRPFVLYVCSSLFRGTAEESTFVADWVRAVRSSGDARLKDVGILIRPHPTRLDEWQHVDLPSDPNVQFWGAHPVTDEAKDDYFDSMYHSAAVVGLNTSAFIEAAAVGRPVHTVLLPHISANNQEGTLHFRYLLEVNGGLLHAARSLDEHVAMLAESCGMTAATDDKSNRFTDVFVRPYGRDVAATPRFVEAVEAAASLPVPAPLRRSLQERLATLLLWPIVCGAAVATPQSRERLAEQLAKRMKRMSRARARAKAARVAEARK